MQLLNVCRSLSNDSVSRRVCFGKHSVAFLLRDGLDVSLRVGLAMFTASELKHFLFGKGAAAFISGQGWFRDTSAGCCACLQERASQHFLRNGSRDISLPRSIVSKTVSQQNALNPSSQKKNKAVSFIHVRNTFLKQTSRNISYIR